MKINSQQDLDLFLNSTRIVKYLDDNRITKNEKKFNPYFKDIAAAKLWSLKYGVASCGNELFAHGKLMITYAEDQIINEK
jgi:hypothetical protein|tara:strand:+ start:382 stop:621 length:240 start_codon:yes stop_codon:yes gene_type:complete